MKIDLEKYIKNHRSELDDVAEFNVDEMWKDFVEKDRPTSRPQFNWLKVAVAAVIVVAAVSLIWQYVGQNRDANIYERLSKANPGLAQEQENLVRLISNQGDLMEELGIDEKQFPELFQELKVLDNLQLEAMNDLDNYQDRKNLYKALMRNYESKARVLELIISEFDKQENEKDYERSIQI